MLNEAARVLGRPPIIALTATAPPWVRDEIIERLGLRRPRLIVQGFDRPNLFYEVYHAVDAREKRRQLSRLLVEGDAPYAQPLGAELAAAGAGAGIVYTARTQRAREISQWLNRLGVHAAYYHGQLKPRQRNAVQERFSEGSLRAIAATNAFGLGIDLPDLRFVAHDDAPPSLEAHDQESGRAGRAGAISRCTLLYCDDELGRVAFAAGAGAIEVAELERVATAFRGVAGGALTRADLARRLGVARPRLARLLESLTTTGAIEAGRGRHYALDLPEERIAMAIDREERRHAHDRTRLEMVRRSCSARHLPPSISAAVPGALRRARVLWHVRPLRPARRSGVTRAHA